MAASVHLLEHQRSDNSTQQFLGLSLGQQQNNCGLSTGLDESYRPNKIEQHQIVRNLKIIFLGKGVIMVAYSSIFPVK